MSVFLSKFEPADFIATLTIIGGFILMAFHIDTIVGGILTVITGFYFGARIRVKSPREDGK